MNSHSNRRRRCLRTMRGMLGAAMLFAPWAAAEVIRVGPTRTLTVPSAAAAVARDGDIVEIDAGEYPGDVAVWTQNSLTLKGRGGRAHLVANGRSAEGKAIWVIKGDETIVEEIEFSGAQVRDRNGAGIRQEGRNLTVRRCFFHDNENGILGGVGEVLVERSEFSHNGFGDGRSHNIYLGRRVSRFTMRFSYSHHARIGHNVKSRAAENHIVYNRIMDETDGNSSYLIDLPNGGIANIIGNVLHQGKRTDNYTLIAYGAEGVTHRKNGLSVIHNTLVNDFGSGIFVSNRAKDVAARLINNLVVGAGVVISGDAIRRGNVVTTRPGFVDRVRFDYRLEPGSPAIDQGVHVDAGQDRTIMPHFEYRHPLRYVKRRQIGAPDAGAHEFLFK